MAFTSTSKKTSEFIYPGATETWVYLDEHPDSMNDAGFFNLHQTLWIDTAATFHNGASGFAFADGHSEIHKWAASLRVARTLQVHAVDGDYLNNKITANVGDPDIRWMSYHAGRVSNNSY